MLGTVDNMMPLQIGCQSPRYLSQSSTNTFINFVDIHVNNWPYAVL